MTNMRHFQGSWLDPRVYSEILQCGEDPDPDYDEEEDLDTQDDQPIDEVSSSSTSLLTSSSTISLTSPPTSSSTSSSANVSANSTMTDTSVSTTSAPSSTTLVTTADISTTAPSVTTVESLTISSCYPATEPTSTDGTKEIEFSVANAAIDKFCETLAESSALIGPETHTPTVAPFFPERIGNNFMGSPIFVHATWNGTGSSCKPLDFGHYSESAVETCRLNLLHTYMGCKYLSFLTNCVCILTLCCRFYCIRWIGIYEWRYALSGLYRMGDSTCGLCIG
jgi:hypothetical protein